MAKEKDDKDLRTRDFVKEMETYARQNGYSRDTALDQLIFVMTAFFSFDKKDRQADAAILQHYNELFRLMALFFFTLRNELEEHEWYDLFGDYFMEVATKASIGLSNLPFDFVPKNSFALTMYLLTIFGYL